MRWMAVGRAVVAASVANYPREEHSAYGQECRSESAISRKRVEVGEEHGIGLG